MVSVKRKGPGAKAVADLRKNIAKSSVLVGITEKNTARSLRDKEPVNNAQLAFIHSHGSPLKGIPARPFLQPAFNAHKQALSRGLKTVAIAGAEGRQDGVHAGLERVGAQAASFAKGWFVDPRNGWAPNKPATIRRKLKGKKVTTGAEMSRPLIDTGQLRRAISWVVKVD